MTASGISSELSAHQMAPGGVVAHSSPPAGAIAHWRPHLRPRASFLSFSSFVSPLRPLPPPSSFFPFVFLLRLATPALRLGVLAGSWQRSEPYVLLRRYGRRSGQPSSSPLARRACVHVLPFSLVLLFLCRTTFTGTSIPRVRLLGHPDVRNRKWPLRGSRRDGNGGRFARSLCPFLTQYTRCCPLGPCTDAVHGAFNFSDHRQWSRRPQPLGSGGDATPCEDPRQEHGPQFNFFVYAVCRVVFNPSGRDLGSDGGRPQNLTARTADAPQRKCSRSARLEERAATRVPSVAHGAGVQGGSRSTRRIQGRRPKSPRGSQCEYPSQGDHPQNWRATSQGPAGALYVFNTDSILAFSAHVAYVPAGVFILYYETMLTYTSVVSCSLDPSTGVSTQGRQTSLQLHCGTLVF